MIELYFAVPIAIVLISLIVWAYKVRKAKKFINQALPFTYECPQRGCFIKFRGRTVEALMRQVDRHETDHMERIT